VVHWYRHTWSWPTAWAALTARGLTNHPKNNQQKKKHQEISMAARQSINYHILHFHDLIARGRKASW
jgi:hypothetical protein